MSSYRIIPKLSYLLSAQWIRDILHMAFLVILARSSTATYGKFMLAINLGHMLLFSTEFGINQHLMITLAKRKEPPKSVINQSLVIKLILFAFTWLTMLGFCLSQGYDRELFVLVLIISTSIGLEAIPSSFYTAYRILNRQDVEARVRTGAALTGYGFGFVSLLAGFPMSVVALYKPIDAAFAIWATLRGYFRKKHVFKLVDLKTLWKNWRESIVFMGMSISAILYNRINLFFIQSHSGPEVVAQYSATWQVVDGISIMVSSMLLGKILFPIFARLWDASPEEFSRLGKSSATLLVAAALPAMFVIGLESDLIITMFFGQQYGDAAAVQPLLVWCILFAFMHNLCAYLMISMRKQRPLFVFYLTGLVVNVVLCMTLIPDAPLQGAAWSIVLTKGVVALLSVGYCQLHLRLISLKTLAMFVPALGMAFALHWAGQSSGINHLGSALGVIPLGALLLYSWRTRPKRIAPSPK